MKWIKCSEKCPPLGVKLIFQENEDVWIGIIKEIVKYNFMREEHCLIYTWPKWGKKDEGNGYFVPVSNLSWRDTI